MKKKPTTSIHPPSNGTSETATAKEKEKTLTKIGPPLIKRQKPIFPSVTEAMSQNLHKKKAEELVQMKVMVDNEFKRTVKTYAASHDMTVTDLIEKSLMMYMAAHP